MISGSDAARIEQWAASTYPARNDGSAIVVQARGNQVHLLEERPGELGTRSRTIVRLKHHPNGRWTVHRVFGGGRWLDDPPAMGSLDEILESIDLAKFPG